MALAALYTKVSMSLFTFNQTTTFDHCIVTLVFPCVLGHLIQQHTVTLADDVLCCDNYRNQPKIPKLIKN